MRLAPAPIRLLALAAALACAAPAATAGETLTDFESVPLATPESYLIDGGAAGGWDVNGHFFNNTFFSDPTYGDSWSGWAFSNQTPSSTGEAFGQYLALPGSGAGGSSNYGIVTAYTDPGGVYSTEARIDLAEGQRAGSIKVTNTEYVSRAITEGYPLGGAFTQGDWFKLTIEGLDAAGDVLGSVVVDLATYTDQLDVVDYWKTVDLTGLGDARSLNFLFTTSVWNQYGPLTPSYAAIDDLVTFDAAAVPEPSSWALMGLGLAGVLARRRLRQRHDG